MAKKPIATFPGLLSVILLILALMIGAFGFYTAYLLKAQTPVDVQIQAFTMLQYLGVSIFLLLIAVLIKLK